MSQLFYQIIYHPKINFILRNLNKALSALLPNSLKIPPSGKIKIQIRNLSFFFLANQTSYVSKLLFWNGAGKFEYTNIFIELAKKVNTFIDVGTNIGYYSILAAKANPEIKVISFEPAAGPLHYLKLNVEVNKIQKNVTVESYAIGDQEGQIEFNEVFNEKYKYLTHNLAGEGNAGSKINSARFKTNQVESMTLDHYLASKKTTSIDLIKLDTEGTEADILRHAKGVIARDQPIIICETLFNTIEKELEEIMSQYDYQFFNHVGNGLQQVKSIERAKDDGVRNCFFVPSGKIHLIEEFILD